MFDARENSEAQARQIASRESDHVWNLLSLQELESRQRQFLASGSSLDFAFRKKQLETLRELIKAYDNELIMALQQDLGKSPTESYMTEIGVLKAEVSETLKQLKAWMRPESRPTPWMFFPARSQVRREPYGRCLIMSPWNYPVQLNIAPAISALAAGNVAVLKPSEWAPQVAKVLRRMIAEGFPPEVLAVVEGDANLSKYLLDERWDLIFFTGGASVGRIVASAAARHLTPCILELGGKSPCIVSAKAKLSLAARRIVWGKFVNAGQTCVAPDYVLVSEKVYQPLLEALASEIHLRFGEQPLANPELSQIVNERHFKRLVSLIDPKKVAFGGQFDAAQRRIAPTLLTSVGFDEPIMNEEIFGPLLPIISVSGLEEAKDIVRRREKPLALYLFSEDAREQEMIARDLSYGGGCMNDVLLHTGNSSLPFGGVGESGIGAYHGKDGFEAFSHRKALFYGSTRLDPPFRYRPWNRWKEKAFRLLLR